jgi:nitrile hydratase subunit beta
MAINPEQALGAARAGASAREADGAPARFKPGDRIAVRNINPTSHTRMPRYIRGRRGVIDRDHGIFVYPDTYAAGLGKKPQHVYSVRFSARELWGPQGGANDELLVDVWDEYMERA